MLARDSIVKNGNKQAAMATTQILLAAEGDLAAAITAVFPDRVSITTLSGPAERDAILAAMRETTFDGVLLALPRPDGIAPALLSADLLDVHSDVAIVAMAAPTHVDLLAQALNAGAKMQLILDADGRSLSLLPTLISHLIDQTLPPDKGLTARRLRRQHAANQATQRVMHTLIRTLDRSQVLALILEQLQQVIAYDSATIMLLDADTLQVVARRDKEKKRPYSRLAYDQLPHVQEVLTQGRPLLIPDTAQDQRWQIIPETEYIRCWLGVPLIVKEWVIGLLNLNGAVPGAYDERDVQLALSFANQAAVAVVNTQLYNQARREIAERKEVEAALQTERARLAQRVEQRTAELSSANAQLARAVRARDEFLASMTHELRTPLNAVLGLSEILQSQSFGPLNQKQRELLETITQRGYHLLDLINDVLDVARIEAGQFELNLLPTSPADVCRRCIKQMDSLATRKKIEVETDIPPDPGKIWVDEARLQQILLNLLHNAIKFTGAHGKISLQVTHDFRRQISRFIITDTGIGLSEEGLKHLYSGSNGPRPFVQIDSGLSRQYEGTGLGLTLVYRLTELHGGSLAIESEPGEGTQMTITLPWHEAETALDKETAVFSPGSPHQPASSCILLAEDNRRTARRLHKALTSQGYQVRIAYNGREAVRLAREMKPHLILMDLQMPEIGGEEAWQLIQEQPGGQDTPVIVISSLILPGDAEKYRERGAIAYLPKPISLSHLKRTIAGCLSAPPPDSPESQLSRTRKVS